MRYSRGRQIDTRRVSRLVTAGLDPAVHSELSHARNRRMYARVKPAHDEEP
jgi:hypothetical protein